MIRTIALVAFLTLMSAAPGRAQNACDALLNGIVTAHGVVSDVVNKESPTMTQFFIRDTDLPCHTDIMVMVDGRIRCSDGKHATIQGKFDIGDLGGGRDTYLILTDSEHAMCR